MSEPRKCGWPFMIYRSVLQQTHLSHEKHPEIPSDSSCLLVVSDGLTMGHHNPPKNRHSPLVQKPVKTMMYQNYAIFVISEHPIKTVTVDGSVPLNSG